MKMTRLFSAVLLATVAFSAPTSQAQQTSQTTTSTDKKKGPPPLSIAPTEPAPAQKTFTYEQRAPTAPAPLVNPDQANTIIERFKAAYPEMGKPRLLIYVNRNLIDDTSGLKLIARTEKTATGAGTKKTTKKEGSEKESSSKDVSAEAQIVTSENRYSNNAKPELTLADRQTVRDVERLFGRPLRMASAKLVDQKVATDMMASGKFESLALEGEQARKDRAALSQHADVAIEILISSKEVKVASFNNDFTYAVPDIQATAIRLKDATILGQSSSADLIGAAPSTGAAQHYGVQEITQATALALMEDMATGYPPAAAAAKP